MEQYFNVCGMIPLPMFPILRNDTENFPKTVKCSHCGSNLQNNYHCQYCDDQE